MKVVYYDFLKNRQHSLVKLCKPLALISDKPKFKFWVSPHLAVRPLVSLIKFCKTQEAYVSNEADHSTCISLSHCED